MHRVIALLACLAVGCTMTSYRWRSASAHDSPHGRPVLVVTADRAVVLEETQRVGGRVGGRPVQMWLVPAGTQALPAGVSLAEIARRRGWVEVAPPTFFATEATAMQRILVGEPTAAGYAAMVVAGAFDVAADVAGTLVMRAPAD